MSSNIVSEYGWNTAEGPRSCDCISPRILKILKRFDVARVLDLGSGNGALCAQLALEGYQVVGVEQDRGGVEVARKSHPQIPFYNFGVQDPVDELLGDETKFDMVVSTEVVEHLFSPHLLPKYAGGCLKDSGYLVITTPYHGYLKNLLLSIFNKWDFHHTALWHGGHIKFWSKATLCKLLSENGFTVVDFSGVGRVPFLWKSMVVIARKS